MGTENREISRYETTVVYSHPEAKVDIILVHGLNGEPDMTWTAKDGTFWPLDLLPAALKGAYANILVYGYNADVYSKGYDRTTSNHFINQHAEDLVTNLMLHRRSQGTPKNPIIWVCHSLGGILVKRALLYSHDVRETHLEDLGSIYVSTFGLIFLATPHVGSDAAAWGVIIQAMANALIPKRFFDSEPVLLKTLRKDNETLANINSHFLDIYQRFEVHMVRENQKTDVKGKRFFVVDANSAGPPLPGVTYYGIEANHADMCKFDSMHSPGFHNIATTLQQWVEKAPCLIQGRWFVAENESRNRTLTRVNEIMSPLAAHRQMNTTHRAVMLSYPSGSPTLLPGYSEDADKEFCFWAPDLPINTNPTSYLWPSPEYLQYPSSHRCTAITDGSLSSPLPNSFNSSTFWPLSAAVGGYVSQPASRQSSPRPEMSIPYTSSFPWSSHAPSFTAIGPSPWYDVTPVNNAHVGYQSWQPRQPVPWNFYDTSREDLTNYPAQDTSSESTDVMRSGSESTQFHGNLIEFGQPEPRSP